MANTTTDDRSGLQITVLARAENVAIVRHALAGLAERVGMDETGVADLKTVVTEACMNVVVHAYPAEEAPGPLEVEAVPEAQGLNVTVRDFGTGIRPRAEIDRPSLRIGLTLIAALSSSFEIKGGIDRGTEIIMQVPLRAREEGSDGAAPGEPPDTTPPEATEMRVGPPELVAPILGRVIGALAARQAIAVDRLGDAMLLSDAISANASAGFKDGHVCLSVADDADGVRLRVGPMEAGGAERLRNSLALPELDASLESLADEMRVEEGEKGEFLVVGIAALSP